MMENLTFKQRMYRKLCKVFCKQLPDKLYLEMMYEFRMGHHLDLHNPQTFNEKLNWLKLYDRNDLYTKLADKYEVREYVKSKIGGEYLIPLLGVYDCVEDIHFENLPDQFVLKCTHDSGSVVICKDKKSFDKKASVTKLAETMRVNYFYPSREWPYKNIRHRIIAEKYMTDESGTELKDYKIYCFHGEPYLIQVDFGRFTHHERNLYSLDWEYIDEQIEYPKNPKIQIEEPPKLELMLKLASKLAGDIPSARIDFYSIGDRVYFGEITFYQEAGFAHFESEDFDRRLGDMIVLSK